MPKNLEKLLDHVTTETQKALGDNLVSLLLYGSHARGDATARSDVNLFLVVRDSSVTGLEPLVKRVPGWIKQRVAAPVVFEQEQLAHSLDTFALEFLEMAAARKILAGEDPFANFSPDWQAVRRELEEEARQKTTQLQRRWFASGGQDKFIRAIIAETVPGYLALLRGTLLVQNQSMTPISTGTIFDSAVRWPGFDPQVWRKLWETAKGLHFPATSALTHLMKDYLEQTRTLVRHIDGLLTSEGTK